MAVITFQLSGAWLVSSTNTALDRIVRSFSGALTASTFVQQEIVVLPNVSDLIVSMALLSSPLGIMMTATNTVRVNFSGQASSVSAASGGTIQFRDMFCAVGPSAILPSAIHIANSGVDSSTVTILQIG
jgi:hypothetical protein